jgi:1-acyl-sn-glycerol-3-phosphate acyltransferase
MADPDQSDHHADATDTGVTVDFSAPASADEASSSALPARLEDLREQLPGLEPDRQITDWGRSERVEGVVDRVVYDFLYHYWFRVEVEGIENVPERGGALLVANHSGTLPSDGAMVIKAVREQHPHHRQVHLATHGSLVGVPGIGMVVTKLGGIPSHPANLHRLLYDEDSLVLAFPEGRAGARKPIRDRYLLRSFEDANFVETAASARVPIVPVAILGAEEASPAFARARRLRRLIRLPSFPLAPALPLPAKFRIRFLEPVSTDRYAERRETEPRDLQILGADVRALIQENLFEMIGARQSVWLG